MTSSPEHKNADAQGLWALPPDVEARVLAQIGQAR